MNPTVVQLLADLPEAGAQVVLRDDGAVVVRTAARVTLDLDTQLRALKPEIVATSRRGRRPEVVPPGLPRDLAAAWRRHAFELAELAGWPRLPYKPAHAV